MPASFSVDVRSAVTAELRTAGCVFAEDEAQLLLDAAGSSSDLEVLVARRVAGEPLEQVLGWAQFAGLRVVVEPGVFVPRRRSEFLVEQAVALTPATGLVVDMCCGSGAIGAALLAQLPGIALHATDIEPAAVRCARRNLGDRGQVYEGDLYAALPAALRGRVDVIVANAPYVPSEEIAFMPPEARIYEPRTALDGGDDGLDIHRAIAANASEWLRPQGKLLIETSQRQAATTASIMHASGFATIVVASDDLDATVVIGSRRELPYDVARGQPTPRG